MGRDEALQIVKEAMEKHRSLFREAWSSGEYTKSHEHWEGYLTLRKLYDESTDSKREGVRGT